MSFNPLPVALAVIGGLIVAGLVAWIKRSRISILVPRTFSYSQFTDEGQLVEISVFNRGFKTEHAIDVGLNRNFAYEIVGSNTEYATLSNKRLQIERIGPSDEATVLLLVEGGTFKPDDITQCLSKDTKGKLVSKLEEVPPTGPQRVGLVAALVGFPVLLFVAYYGFTHLLASSEQLASSAPTSSSKQVAKASTIEVQGWTVPGYYKTTSGSLFNSFSDGKVQIRFEPTERKGKWVTVPFTVINSTSKVITASISMLTAASSKEQKSYDLTSGDILVVPNQSQERSIRVIIPEASSNEAERTIFVDGFIRTADGDSLSIHKRIVNS
jgi:hypothetical protein